MSKVDNAIIMAAGTSSRFAPLSFERPKSLFPVRGEILIERQIKQLKEAGINDIIVVTGYMKESFEYLKNKYGVHLVNNDEYPNRNNNGSIYAARKYLRNSYVCSSDNYFIKNPFENKVDESYYAAVYVDGPTDEWCLATDDEGYIQSATVGGKNSWYMLGHTFWNEEFSKKFIEILEQEYEDPVTASKLWETIYLEHIDELRMKIRKYPKDFIFEFDTLDELRQFDPSYRLDSRSAILKRIAAELQSAEGDFGNIKAIKGHDAAAIGFEFAIKDRHYQYDYETKTIRGTEK